MGFWDWLFKRQSAAAPAESIGDVADRLDRYGDRFANAADAEGERAAREAAQAARRSSSLEIASRIEREFLSARGLRQEAGLVSNKPRAGQRSAELGSRYVLYGRSARVGGSRSWRNNNPAYIRCSSRAMTYGATGCDGEYAIFPDVNTGLDAIVPCLRDEYPSQTLGEALRRQLPPEEAGEGAAERIQQQTGVDPNQKIEDMTDEQLLSVAEVCQEQAGWLTGETYERGGPAPNWVESLWEQPAAARAPEAATPEPAPSTDDS